jgi:hypothetical protein
MKKPQEKEKLKNKMSKKTWNNNIAKTININ